MSYEGRKGRTLLETVVALSEVEVEEIEIKVGGEEGGELVVACATATDELDESMWWIC